MKSFILLVFMALSINLFANPVIEYNKNEVIITLKANSTTGYQWTIQKYDPKLIKLEKKCYKYPNTALLGSPGEAIFRFKILKKESSEIIFGYMRPWEQTAATIKKIRLKF